MLDPISRISSQSLIPHSTNCSAVIIPATPIPKRTNSVASRPPIRVEIENDRKRLEDLLMKADTDGIGAINYEEFQRFSLQLLQAIWVCFVFVFDQLIDEHRKQTCLVTMQQMKHCGCFTVLILQATVSSL